MKRILLTILLFVSGFMCQLKAQQATTMHVCDGFIENKGQIVDQNYTPNKDVKYLLCSPGFNVQLRQNGFSYDTYTDSNSSTDKEISFGPQNKPAKPESFTRHYHRVDINLAGCNTDAQIVGEDKLEAYYNYFTAGTPEGGVSNVHCYGKVIYKNIYPNIDLEFTTRPATGNVPVEYNFIVHPGGNPANIKLAYYGANKVKLDSNKLVVSVAAGSFTENIPSSYLKDTKQAVAVNYVATGKNTFGFSLPDSVIPPLEGGEALIIDPTPCRNWGTYYGGGNEFAWGIALDAADNSYITGATASATNIATAGAYQTVFAGSYDAYVAKLNPTGTALIWGTYYGGAGDDRSYGIALDAANNIFITGYTGSNANIATPGTYQTVYGGNTYDSFVAKFNSTGTALLWGTYYGGSGVDESQGIAIDAADNIFITGYTTSTNQIATAGAYQLVGDATNGDAFVAKFNSTGTSLLWGTFYGGANLEWARGISLDALDNVYIVGYTASPTQIATAGAYQTIFAGGQDAFVAKFNPTGTSLIWGTYYGGTGTENGDAITLDAAGNIYITGSTASLAGIATPGAYLTVGNASGLAFVAKFNPTGTSLIWGTYYGGTLTAFGSCIVLDAADNVYIAGTTQSVAGIASVGAYQTVFGGLIDCFVAKFNPTGTSLLWGTYYGGAKTDQAWAITLDAADNVYVLGFTNSTGGISTPGAYRVGYIGVFSVDAFVVEFGCNPVVLPVSLLSFNADCGNGNVVLSWSTASETNNKYFTIERSSDGINFQAIATIPGAGNSDAEREYTYTDTDPQGGNNYYRLSQTDYDGNSTSYNITTCNANTEEIGNVYPNPTTGKFSVSVNATVSELQIFNALGQKIAISHQPPANGEIQIDLSAEPSGVYILNIIQSDLNKTITKKIVVYPR